MPSTELLSDVDSEWVDAMIYVTSSEKPCLIDEQTVSSLTIWFHTFVQIFRVKTVQGVPKKFTVDVYQRQIS